jgi:hypothetical protein
MNIELEAITFGFIYAGVWAISAFVGTLLTSISA